MSNFTCPTCGLTNIDCGKAGYKTAREIELEEKLKIAEEALTDVCLYRYDVSDTDQEDWFKIATYMAKVAGKAKEKIRG